MREKVIIFDGEKDQEIGAPYFFQDDRIRDLNKEQVLELYKSTAIKAKVLKTVKAEDGPVKLEVSAPEYLYKVERGLAILEKMVLDMYGDGIGTCIIVEFKTQLTQASK